MILERVSQGLVQVNLIIDPNDSEARIAETYPIVLDLITQG